MISPRGRAARIARQPLLLAEALATRIAVDVELRTRALDSIVAPPRRCRPAHPEDIDRIGEITEFITTGVPALRSRCLVRALLRFRMLRRRGYDAAVVLGLDPTRPELEGHAWVELNGVPLYENQPLTCVPTLRSP